MNQKKEAGEGHLYDTNTPSIEKIMHNQCYRMNHKKEAGKDHLYDKHTHTPTFTQTHTLHRKI